MPYRILAEVEPIPDSVKERMDEKARLLKAKLDEEDLLKQAKLDQERFEKEEAEALKRAEKVVADRKDERFKSEKIAAKYDICTMWDVYVGANKSFSSVGKCNY